MGNNFGNTTLISSIDQSYDAAAKHVFNALQNTGNTGYNSVTSSMPLSGGNDGQSGAAGSSGM